jgi:hypothetical protein
MHPREQYGTRLLRLANFLRPTEKTLSRFYYHRQVGPVAYYGFSTTNSESFKLGSTRPSADDPNPADPVASFPASPHVTGQLARYFFEASSIHWYCVAVHKPVFYDAYLEFFSARHHNAPDLDFCVLLAAMCALTLQFCGDADAQVGLRFSLNT